MLSLLTTIQALPEQYTQIEYQPSTLFTYRIAQRENLSFIVFAGSWCPDCQRNVGKIVKLEDALPDAKFQYIAHLPRSKKDDQGLTEKYQITRIPTLVILQNDEEIGRIVESTRKSWEEDIYNILIVHEAEQKQQLNPHIPIDQHDPDTFYITTPIYYTSGIPHIGHLFTTMLEDYMVRYVKQKQYTKTFALTGCDEHGLKVQQAAEARNLSPQELVDQLSVSFKKQFQKFELDQYDRFIRTTDEDHIITAQKVWTLLEKEGYIYKSNYTGYYDVSDECFVTQKELEEFVDEDGVKKFRTIASKHICNLQSEENYMFKLTALRDKLVQYYESHPEAVYPTTLVPVLIQYIKSDMLTDFSISRDKSRLSWGIPVPNDDNQVMYVWIDALCNYITAVGDKKCWPPRYQLIGKDIQRFHCIYYIAMLLALNIEPPTHFLVHGWFLSPSGEKISKSLKNYKSPDELLEICGIDGLRAYMIRQNFYTDMEISDKQVAQCWDQLGNNLGNLVNRIISVKVNSKQQIPELPQDVFQALKSNNFLIENENQKIIIKNLISDTNTLYEQFDQFVSQYNLKAAYDLVDNLITQLNALMQEIQPWKLAKSENKEDIAFLDVINYISIECLRICIILYKPILIHKADIMLQQIGINPQDPEQIKISKENLTFGKQTFGNVFGTDKQIIFKKVDLNEKYYYSFINEQQAQKNQSLTDAQIGEIMISEYDIDLNQNDVKELNSGYKRSKVLIDYCQQNHIQKLPQVNKKQTGQKSSNEEKIILDKLKQYCQQYNVNKNEIINNPQYQNKKDQMTFAMYLAQKGIEIPIEYYHDLQLRDNKGNAVKDYLQSNNKQVPQEWNQSKQIKMTGQIKQELQEYCQKYNIDQQLVIDNPKYKKYFTFAMWLARKGIVPPQEFQHDPKLQSYGNTVAIWLEKNGIETPSEWQYDPLYRVKNNQTTAMRIAFYGKIPSKCWEHDPNVKDQFDNTVQDHLIMKKLEVPGQWKVEQQ